MISHDSAVASKSLADADTKPQSPGSPAPGLSPRSSRLRPSAFDSRSVFVSRHHGGVSIFGSPGREKKDANRVSIRRLNAAEQRELAARMEKKQMKEFMTVRLRSLFSAATDFAFFIFIFFVSFWISLSSTTHMSAGPKKENNR